MSHVLQDDEIVLLLNGTEINLPTFFLFPYLKKTEERVRRCDLSDPGEASSRPPRSCLEMEVAVLCTEYYT